MPGLENDTIRLYDGRALGYSTYGPINGFPVLYFHGTPGSRLEVLLCEAYGVNLYAFLKKYGIKLISVDRPGMGLSSFNKKGNYLSFAQDVKYLLHFLDIHQCSVMCWSGGGPYALAIAYKYPQVINAAFIIAGLSRRLDEEVIDEMFISKKYFQTAKNFPWVLRFGLKMLRGKQFKKPISQKKWDLPDVDYEFVKQVEPFNKFIKNGLRQATKVDTDGAVYEAQQYYNDFGFSSQAIKQPVHFWWGEQDTCVIHLHAKKMEEEIPNVVPHYKKNEGHISIYLNCMEEVIETIAGLIPEKEAERNNLTSREAYKNFR